jgi:hypothetical protein
VNANFLMSVIPRELSYSLKIFGMRVRDANRCLSTRRGYNSLAELPLGTPNGSPQWTLEGKHTEYPEP